jgi:hypothetical protein
MGRISRPLENDDFLAIANAVEGKGEGWKDKSTAMDKAGSTEWRLGKVIEKRGNSIAGIDTDGGTLIGEAHRDFQQRFHLRLRPKRGVTNCSI